MTSLLLQEWKCCMGMESIDNKRTHENKNRNDNDNDNDTEKESSHSLPADMRVEGGYNTGPQKGTVMGFHILR